jgi:glycosyltransferase involved in cell wall biosynthesis
MKLVVVSHTPHYARDGAVFGWGPTVREISVLARDFTAVTHVAPLHDESPPASALAYDAANVRLRTVPPPTARTSREVKLRTLALAPIYMRALLEELRDADVVHVRCPAYISLIAIVLLAVKSAPPIRWAKYAGNWQPHPGESSFSAIQRWWLARGLHRGVVTVNGEWPDQPAHVASFVNPCLTEDELEEGRRSAAGKQIESPVRLLFVGRLEEGKGVRQLLEIVSSLVQQQIPVTLDLVGDGPERDRLARDAERKQIHSLVRFHGWLPRASIGPIYARSHLLLFPSRSEGWPKVVSEGMAYGVVPVSSAVGSIAHYLERFQAGRALPPDDLEGFVQSVAWYASHPGEWKEESDRSVRAAALFGYEHYLTCVRDLLRVAGSTGNGSHH